MGWVTFQVWPLHGVYRYLAGAVVGGSAEILNLTVLHLWSFPAQRVWGLALPVAGILGLAVAWGFLPLLVPLVIKKEFLR